MAEDKDMLEKIKLMHEKLQALAMKKGSINEEDVYFSLQKVGENAKNAEKFIALLQKRGVKIIKTNDEDLFKNDFSIYPILKGTVMEKLKSKI